MTTKKKTTTQAKSPAKKPAAKAAPVKKKAEAAPKPQLSPDVARALGVKVEAPKPKARTANARTAPEVKTTKGGQRYVERKLIKAPAQKG